MLTPAPTPWIVRGATFALWALAAGSAAYWGLKLTATSRPVNAPVAAPRLVGPVDAVALGRLLGSSPGAVAAAPPPPALASRFQLLGVAAGEFSGGGGAVIAIDGKPPRSYRVGSLLEEGLVLQSVHGRQAVIATSDGRPALTLELPVTRLDTSNRPAPMAAPQSVAPPPVAPLPMANPAPPQPIADPAQAPSAAPR